MAVTTTNLGVITAYGDAVAAGYTGTKAEWQTLMASYATVGQQAVDAKNDAVAAKDTAVSKATEATTAANTATTKANEASASAQSIAQSASQIAQNTSDISELKEDLTLYSVALDLEESNGYLTSPPVDTLSSQTATKEKTTDNITNFKQLKISLTYTQTRSMWIAVGVWYKDGTRERIVIAQANTSAWSGVFNGTTSIERVRISYRSYDEAQISITQVGLLEPVQESIDTSLSAYRLPIKNFRDNLVLAKEITWTSESQKSQEFTFNRPACSVLIVDYSEIPSDVVVRYQLDTVIGGVQVPFAYGSKVNSTYVVFSIKHDVTRMWIRSESLPESGSYKVKFYDVPQSCGIGEAVMSGVVQSKYVTSPITTNQFIQKQWSNGGASAATTRISTRLFNLYGTMTISLSDSTNYKFAVIKYLVGHFEKMYSDSGWQTSDYTMHIGDETVFGIVIAKVDNSALSADDVDLTVTITPTDKYSIVKVAAYKEDLVPIQEVIDEISPTSVSLANNKANMLFTQLAQGKMNQCYDHLFVNNTGANVVIPHESLYHVRMSKRLGFNVIEANCTPTSDGVLVVNHFSSGKFGGYFHHVDGETDISNVAVNSVTWAWIVENVRYNSSIPKYRTRPSRLEEFLGECKQQGLIPFVYNATGAYDIADAIMGKDNYIAYGGTRSQGASKVIYNWTSIASKEAAVALCKSVGAPCIIGMSNPTDFTLAQLKEIVDAVHDEGCLIGTSYADTNWHNYSYVGMDINGTQHCINRIKEGNVCDINSIFGFDDFTFTNATETDGVLTYTADGTLEPTFTAETLSVGGADLQIEFDGEITVPSIGETLGATYASDGSIPVFVAAAIIGKSPALTIEVASGTVVYDCTYKVSKF